MGGGISSKEEDLRSHGGQQAELRKMAAVVALSTRKSGGAMVPVAELSEGVVDPFAPQANCGGKVFGLVRIPFQLLMVSLGGITEDVWIQLEQLCGYVFLGDALTVLCTVVL